MRDQELHTVVIQVVFLYTFTPPGMRQIMHKYSKVRSISMPFLCSSNYAEGLKDTSAPSKYHKVDLLYSLTWQ